jgi:cation diffusion facilitator CzcD-associated flavoprotein CzcO
MSSLSFRFCKPNSNHLLLLLLLTTTTTTPAFFGCFSTGTMMASALATTASTATVSASASASSPRIAVIGAGAAGLAAARVISREGWTPTVLEKEVQGGGVWRYKDYSSSSDSAVNDKKDRPVYRGLRTNLPKELMAFREFPFSTSSPKNDASFVTHAQVQDYLLDYQATFGLEQYIRFGCQVQQLKVMIPQDDDRNNDDNYSSRIAPQNKKDPSSWPTFQLEWQDTTTGTLHSEIFDAVLVCNGHYAAPSTPSVPGLVENFKGKVMHSIEYDNPKDFTGQAVLCVGGRASGADLAREISQYANHVYLSDSTCAQVQEDGKVTLVPKTTRIEPNGEIRFGNEGNSDECSSIRPTNVDTIIFCSGYDYHFPFLNDRSKSNLELNVIPGERRVSPLFQQLWHARHPSLAFVGLPHSVVPFPLFELQVEAVCEQWNHCRLPALKERLDSAQQDASSGGPKQGGRVPQDTHFMGDFQWDYCRDMAKWVGRGDDPPALEGYIRTNQELYDHAGQARKSGSPGGPDSYRSLRYERPQWDQWKVVPLPSSKKPVVTN